MMSEIEKLYENAGVEIQYGYDVEYNKKSEHYRLLNCNKNAVITLFPEYKSKGYKVTKVNKMANFTAEKQLKLIRYIALNDNIDYVKYYYQAIKGVWVFVSVTVTELASEMPKVYGAYHEEFEQALAGLINNLWQDLTEEEKAEIRRILE